MKTLRHRACLHEFEVEDDFAERIQNDLNGGSGAPAPPVICPGCKMASRYSQFIVLVTPNA